MKKNFTTKFGSMCMSNLVHLKYILPKHSFGGDCIQIRIIYVLGIINPLDCREFKKKIKFC